MMHTSASKSCRLECADEVKELVALCKAGKLFEIQGWIAAGKPVNGPPLAGKGTRSRTPLEVAIESGFHSLVQVLLAGGAIIEPEGRDSPMNRALKARRFDIVKLLVEHGFDAASVDMAEVFASWDPEIMTYFIDKGADVESGNPFAFALCNRIRTALGIYKRHKERCPSLAEQGNIALRFNCKEGNAKWASLLIWAGADPLKPGTENYYAEKSYDDDEGLSALGFAALYGHYEIFALRQLQSILLNSKVRDYIQHLCHGDGVDVLKRLLEQGLNPNGDEETGCSAIQYCLYHMEGSRAFSSSGIGNDFWFDYGKTRETMRAIHLLAKHGGRWVPKDAGEINAARRSLLTLAPDYTVEFAWIMTKYRACAQECLVDLLRTPRIKSHTSAKRQQLEELALAWSGGCEA